MTPFAPGPSFRAHAEHLSASWSCSGRRWEARAPYVVAFVGLGTGPPESRPDVAEEREESRVIQRGKGSSHNHWTHRLKGGNSKWIDIKQPYEQFVPISKIIRLSYKVSITSRLCGLEALMSCYGIWMFDLKKTHCKTFYLVSAWNDPELWTLSFSLAWLSSCYLLHSFSNHTINYFCHVSTVLCISYRHPCIHMD